MEPLHLSDGERVELERWVWRRKGAEDMALRARLILACDAIGENGLPVSTKVVASLAAGIADHAGCSRAGHP
ncbi:MULTISPECIES: hypothetical protein [unclassified Nonomuraea]|uniref:hypothetical protein n=1 Tax=unclassified Nonomuraea TaxID=2593643 RepID=UPI0014875A5C|nr:MULTISPECIES: hypothetical protein [unclassified Nonomuraea]